MRAALEYIKTKFGDKALMGAEVGVYRGEHAKDILDNMPITKLYLIDRQLLPQLKDVYLEIYDRAIFLYGESQSMSAYVPNNFLDFIYIDASHDTNSVLRDIVAWFPKLKKNSVMCGHDYGNERDCPGVKVAVNKIVNDNNFKLHTNADGTEKNSDWWIDLSEWTKIK